MTNTVKNQTTVTAPAPSNNETTTPTPNQKQLYFVPEYHVSVEATSLEEAITLAKTTKGNK